MTFSEDDFMRGWQNEIRRKEKPGRSCLLVSSESMRPIIFLDIDGVLVTERSMRSGNHRSFDPEAVAALRWLVSETGAAIVVSSTWRYGMSLTALRSCLRIRGLTGVRIIGVTPDLAEPVGSCSLVAAPTRGKEIAAWLATNGRAGPFVILDDDSDMDELLPFLVETDFAVGLTMEQARTAIEIMRRKIA